MTSIYMVNLEVKATGIEKDRSDSSILLDPLSHATDFGSSEGASQRIIPQIRASRVLRGCRKDDESTCASQAYRGQNERDE